MGAIQQVLASFSGGYPLPDGLEVVLRGDRGTWQNIAGTTPAISDSDPVLRWDDQSDNSNHVFFENSAAPFNCSGGTLKTAQLNALSVLRFNGTSDGFKFTNVFRQTDRTYYSVVRSSGTGTKTIICGNKHSLQWRLDDLRPRLVDSIAADIGLANNSIPSGAWTQIDVTWNFTSGTFGLSGASDGTVTLSDSGYASTRTIGCNLSNVSGSPAGEVFSGDVALIMIYIGIHTSLQKSIVRTWIAQNFGV